MIEKAPCCILDTTIPRCEHAINMKDEFESCRDDVLSDLKNTKTELFELRAEVHELRTDVGGIRDSVNKMSSSLELIATSMAKLTDFPETWQKIKGFWAVVTWLKNNLLSILILLALVVYAIKSGFLDLL